MEKANISPEKCYQFSESLKNVFKNSQKKNEFYLSELFDKKLKAENKLNLPSVFNNEQTKKLMKTEIEDPVQLNDSNAENYLYNNAPIKIPTTVSPRKTDKCKIWGETFFFKTDDPRLKDAVKFYSDTNANYEIKDYNVHRSKLKSIIRKKILNSRTRKCNKPLQ